MGCAHSVAILILIHDDIQTPMEAVSIPQCDLTTALNRSGHRSTQQVVRRFDLGFGGDLPFAGDLADANQPGPFMIVLQPADGGRDLGCPGLDPPVVGIHRGVGYTGLASRVVEIKADIRMQGALVALQG
jgi:hypothetical protein